MPESRIRRRAAYTEPSTRAAAPRPSPRWWVPVMLALMVLGLLWIVAFYLLGSDGPVPQLHAWNLAAGFVLILVGFAMTTRWR